MAHKHTKMLKLVSSQRDAKYQRTQHMGKNCKENTTIQKGGERASKCILLIEMCIVELLDKPNFNTIWLLILQIINTTDSGYYLLISKFK